MVPLLALTGFMGSGKTSVGAEVAKLLRWRFVDLDETFERTQATTIAAFFACEGESAFRAQEGELLRSILQSGEAQAGLVVALGGGTLESPGATSLLKSLGGVVYLDVDPADAWSRVKDSGRPLARNRDDFDALLAKRRATYEEAADWVIPVCSGSIGALAREIADLVRATGADWSKTWGRRLVRTGRPSTILGGRDSLSTLASWAAAARNAGSQLFVISDENVMRHWGERVGSLLDTELASASVRVLEPGENSKSVRTAERCWDWLVDRRARRQDVIVALGGGVVGDLAGFVAATYHRGVSLWQVPTSLLAQVDSSVGGKTAVNLDAGKNLVGCFYQPDVVFADPATLVTLPDHEYTGGLGEVVKYALLVPGNLFMTLENEAQTVLARDLDVMGRLVKTCVAYKARLVEADERDTGLRAVLNLGHTTAHALEVALGYGTIGHGQAVGLGLVVALAVSERLLKLDPIVRERTCSLLKLLGLPVAAHIPETDVLVAAAGQDKKVTAGSSGLVGLRALGDPVWGLDVPGAVLREALEVIRA